MRRWTEHLIFNAESLGSLMAPRMERRRMKRFRFISGNVSEDFATLHQFTRVEDKSTLSTQLLRLGMLGNTSRKTNQSPSCRALVSVD